MFLEVSQAVFVEAELVGGGVGLVILGAFFEHVIDDAGELAGGGGVGFGGAEVGFLASIEDAQAGVGAAERLRGEAEGGGGAVDDFAAAAA